MFRMLLQETFVLGDYLKYDLGTTDKHTDSVWNNVDLFTRTDTYTIFTDTSNQIRYVSISGDVCIEVDISTDMPSYQGLIQIRQSATVLTEMSLDSLNLQQNTWNRIKCEIKNNMCTFSCNGVSTTPVDVTNFNRFYLRCVANKNTLFKNLVVYSA